MARLDNAFQTGLALAVVAAIGSNISAQDKEAKGEVVSKLDPAIMRVHQARTNDYWFASKDQGVYRYDGKSLVRFTSKDGLTHDNVGGIQEDKAGNLYFTTSSDFDPVRRRFTQAICRFDGKRFTELAVPEKTTDAWKLQPDDLWFGGGQDSGVLYRYDGKEMHRLELPPTKEGDDFLAAHPRAKFPNAKFSPYDTYLHFKDSKGHLWFGTSNLGVCRYDGKTFVWIPEGELRNGSFGTRSVVEDKEGKFWFCDSMHRYTIDAGDKAGPRFTREVGLRDTKDATRPRIVGIISAVVDRDGVLWMATYGDGVWRYDGKDVTRFPVTDGGKQITLFTIGKDNRGDLWLGTHAAGPYKFNGKTFEKFTP